MAMDDLFKSLNMFSDGMQQLSINKGINDASQQVSQINNSMADEMAKRQMRQQAASQLALHLVGAGANANQVTQASTALAGPQASDSASLFQQGLATGDQSLMKAAKDAQTFESAPGLQKVAAEGTNTMNVAKEHTRGQIAVAEIKGDKNQRDMLTKSATQFNAATKDIRAQLDTMDGMQGMLDSKNPISDAAIKNQLPRILGDMKGRLPIQEVMMFGGSQSLWDKVKRGMETNFKGLTFTDQDRADIVDSMNRAKAAKEKALANNMQMYAGQGLQTGAFTSVEHGLATLQGNDPRLKRLSGLDQAASPGGAPAAPQAKVEVISRTNPKTGKIQKFQITNGDMKNAVPID